MYRPLVTFAMFAYNQERFVGEAIEGAFAQTYEPIEIILSDDCSPDRTFDIMQEKTAAYRGPHKVRLNRNPKNIGLVAHVNRVMEMVTGEVIVAAAGDDISLPERTQICVDEFGRANGCVVSLYGASILIDEQGRSIGRFTDVPRPQAKTDLIYRVEKQAPGLHGASHAWHRRLYDEFGPMRSDVGAEDRVFAFRAWELGEILALDRDLIKYRVHENNFWFGVEDQFNYERHRMKCIRRARAWAANFRQYLDDLQHPIFLKNHSASELDRARRAAERQIRIWQLEEDFVTTTRLGRFGVVARAVAAGVRPRKTANWLARSVLPERVYYKRVLKSNRRFASDVERAASESAGEC